MRAADQYRMERELPKIFPNSTKSFFLSKIKYAEYFMIEKVKHCDTSLTYPPYIVKSLQTKQKKTLQCFFCWFAHKMLFKWLRRWPLVLVLSSSAILRRQIKTNNFYIVLLTRQVHCPICCLETNVDFVPI